MNEPTPKIKNNFTSYLEEEVLNGSEDAIQANLAPKLLSGELEVARAPNVALYPPTCKLKDEQNSIFGLLVVTNFKLTFLTAQKATGSKGGVTHQENAFLGQYDVTLSNIDCIYQIIDKKKKAVGPQLKISSKIEALHIVCKNFRLLKFSFKKSEIGKGKHIAEALAKFAFPNRHNLLFFYNFRENYYNTVRNVSMYQKKADWLQEVARCGATGWRVLSINVKDVPNRSLPMHFVTPKSLSEAEYMKYANYFRDGRTAFWVFSLKNASLVRMGELLPAITESLHENTMMEHVRKSDPQTKQPYLMELSKILPSIQDIQQSYIKLRELCTPDSARLFMIQDNKYYNMLDKSCWLLYVSLCLKYASEASQRLRNGETVVLQENDGRDMCCVVSSLTQMLLDPHFRTLAGFQSLVQKEWVALSHPFSDRLGHVINTETSEQSPLFLLFLDCSWQLLQQYPEEFEFSETFLTSLWDAIFLPIFDTFQFNSDRDRFAARDSENLILRPVWEWGEQFSDNDIVLFTNPFYKRPTNDLTHRSVPVVTATATSSGQASTPHSNEPRYLVPQHSIRDLDIWTQCYCRWLPIVEIRSGGYAQIELYNRVLCGNIMKLQQAIQTRDFDDLPASSSGSRSAGGGDDDGGPITPTAVPCVDSFFPFSGTISNTNELTEILTLNNDFLAEGSIFDGLSLSQAPD